MNREELKRKKELSCEIAADIFKFCTQKYKFTEGVTPDVIDNAFVQILFSILMHAGSEQKKFYNNLKKLTLSLKVMRKLSIENEKTEDQNER